MRRRWWALLGICALAIAVPGVVIAAGPGGEHAPGAKFKLYGTATNGTDPQNAFNDVVSVDTTNGSTAAWNGSFRATSRSTS